MRLPLYARFRSGRSAAAGRPLVALSAAALLLTGLVACTTGSAGSPDTSPPSTQAAVTPSAPTTAPPDNSAPATGSDQSTPPTSGDTTPAGPASSGGTSATGSATKTVPVQITINDWNTKSDRAEVDAFVPGVVISGGTCTLTLSQGSTSRTATHPAVTTPSSTSCGLMSIPHAQLAAGTWRAVVRFHAPNAAGRSDAVTIQVPA